METDGTNKKTFPVNTIRDGYHTKLDNGIMCNRMRKEKLIENITYTRSGKWVFFFLVLKIVCLLPWSVGRWFSGRQAGFVLALNALQTDWWLLICLLSVLRSTYAQGEESNALIGTDVPTSICYTLVCRTRESEVTAKGNKNERVLTKRVSQESDRMDHTKNEVWCCHNGERETKTEWAAKVLNYSVWLDVVLCTYMLGWSSTQCDKKNEAHVV